MLSASLGGLSSLASLSVRGAHLTGPGARILVHTFTRLVQLDLSKVASHPPHAPSIHLSHPAARPFSPAPPPYTRLPPLPPAPAHHPRMRIILGGCAQAGLSPVEVACMLTSSGAVPQNYLSDDSARPILVVYAQGSATDVTLDGTEVLTPPTPHAEMPCPRTCA